MRGRKKKQNAKRKVIRITDKVSYGLFKMKKDLHLPYYYRESDIIQVLLIEIENILNEPVNITSDIPLQKIK